MLNILAASFILAVQPAGPPEPVTAFVNVSVIAMDRDRVLTGQTVIVRGERIAEIGPVDRVRVPAEAVRVDGQGQFLLPGLGDMHVHLLPLGTGPDSVAAVERLLLRFLANGITTVRNMDGRPAHLALRARAAAGELVSPRIYTSGPQLDNVPTPAAAARAVAEHRAAGYDFLKVYSLKPEVFDTLVAAANRAGFRFAGHVTGGSLERALAAGYASIEHLRGYVSSLRPAGASRQTGPAPLDESRIPVIAAATRRAGVWNVPTQVVWEALPDWVLGMLVGKAPDPALRRTVTAINRKFIKALHDAGAGVLLGTDASVCHSLSIHRELELTVAAGLTPYQALEAGTRNVAVFLGTLERTGTVAVGKRADLLLLAANPLVDIRHTARPAGVMIGGRWLSRDSLDRRLAATAVGSQPECSGASTP